MPESLTEISGLSLTPDGKQLSAIDDEKGVIFLINKENGKVERQINFWEDGDYEGIEIVGNDAYAVKSSGSIFVVRNHLSEDRKTEKIKSFLNKENDVEGLGYDPKANRLLLGCKGKGIDGEGAALKKAIYALDLASLEINSKPVYVLSVQAVQHYLEHYDWDAEGRERLMELFSPETKEMKFSPSGIAVHPLTGDIYITSATGKMLLVLSREGEILFLEKLKKNLHAQPEGISFDAGGTLYISNEGKDGAPGKIYGFKYRTS